jgi:hypothetical protein
MRVLAGGDAVVVPREMVIVQPAFSPTKCAPAVPSPGRRGGNGEQIDTSSTPTTAGGVRREMAAICSPCSSSSLLITTGVSRSTASSGDATAGFPVREVLRPPASTLVGFEVAEADERNLHPTEPALDTFLVACVEGDARNAGEYLDPERRDAQPNDAVVIEKQRRRELGRIETKFAERPDRALRIFPIDGYPNVEILGCPRISMVADGVATYDEIPNTMGMEQFQELFEVLR